MKEKKSHTYMTCIHTYGACCMRQNGGFKKNLRSTFGIRASATAVLASSICAICE